MTDAPLVAFNAHSIPWTRDNADGTRSALLEGQRGVGTYTYAFYMPPGFWDESHSHAADVRLVVLSGELLLSSAHGADRETASAYPAGSWLFVPALHPHADGADVPTIIVGTATGAWSSEYA